jgi:hypothetical protein
MDVSYKSFAFSYRSTRSPRLRFKAANMKGVVRGVSESGAAGAEIVRQEGMVIIEEAMSKSEAIKSDPRNAKRHPSA